VASYLGPVFPDFWAKAGWPNARSRTNDKMETVALGFTVYLSR
jgi:hypothetical protein